MTDMHPAFDDRFAIHSFSSADKDELNQLAITAWSEYSPHYLDWQTSRAKIKDMAALAQIGEIILCKQNDQLIGGVAYIPPYTQRADYFDPAWGLIRMLVVSPAYRGQKIGRALTLLCIDRACAAGVETIALHTSPMMVHAVALYERLGFVQHSPAPSDTTFPYFVYVKNLLQKEHL